MVISGLAIWDLLRKDVPTLFIRLIFGIFASFFIGMVALGFILEAPNDAAWVRNSVEALFMGWMVYRIIGDGFKAPSLKAVQQKRVKDFMGL